MDENGLQFIYHPNPLNDYAPDIYLDNTDEIPTDDIYESHSDSESSE